MKSPVAVRMFSRIQQSGDCWEYVGPRLPKGYGIIQAGGRRGRKLGAHRAMWEIVRGPIPAGMCVLHHCDNPPCVYPGHLFLGTIADNSADMVAKDRGPRQKLSVDDVPKMIEMYSGGATLRHVGGAFGVSPLSAANAIYGRTFRFLDRPAGITPARLRTRPRDEKGSFVNHERCDG